MLRILLRIWQAQKYTFEQHLPGKMLFAPLAQLAEQLTLNSKQRFWTRFAVFGLAVTAWDKLETEAPRFVDTCGRKWPRFHKSVYKEGVQSRFPPNFTWGRARKRLQKNPQPELTNLMS